jgi:hypothetical protein
LKGGVVFGWGGRDRHGLHVRLPVTARSEPAHAPLHPHPPTLFNATHVDHHAPGESKPITIHGAPDAVALCRWGECPVCCWGSC